MSGCCSYTIILDWLSHVFLCSSTLLNVTMSE